MKITAVRPHPVWLGRRNQLLVKVETDEGIHGWGESGLSGRERAVAGAVEHYREFLIGRDPFAIGALWQEMYRSQYFEGGRVLTAAISALDIALHDIKGKALGVPVHELLGGMQRHTVPGFASTREEPGEAMIEEARALQAGGWRCIRLSPSRPDEGGLFEPRRSIAATVPWLIRAREALGAEMVVGIDYHHRLSVAEAASFCQKLPTGTLDWLEEPIRDECPSAYAALRQMTDIPFAIGEEFASKWQFQPYVERDLAQFARLDICNIGGFTEAMKVAGWCEAHYVDLMPHNPLGPICTDASVHFSAAIANLSWLEVGPDDGRADARVFPVQVKLEGTGYGVPTTPGLGVEVDENALSSDTFRYWEAPHLRREDGSLTNW